MSTKRGVMFPLLSCYYPGLRYNCVLKVYIIVITLRLCIQFILHYQSKHFVFSFCHCVFSALNMGVFSPELMWCVAHLLAVSQIPEEMVSQSRNSYMEAELMVPPLDELCKAHEEEVDEEEEEEDEEGSYYAHLESLVQNLLKEAKDKSKSWVSRSTTDNAELAFKKVCGHWILRKSGGA